MMASPVTQKSPNSPTASFEFGCVSSATARAMKTRAWTALRSVKYPVLHKDLLRNWRCFHYWIGWEITMKFTTGCCSNLVTKLGWIDRHVFVLGGLNKPKRRG